MGGEDTQRFDETFQHVTGTGDAGQYDREQIVGEINRLRGSEMGAGAPQLLTDLGKGWNDAADKLDAVRDRVESVGERLAEVWCSQASVASQRALMRIHDASQDLSGTASGMHRYLDGVGATMGQHLASFPTGDGEGAAEGFMGDYGRVLASGMSGPAGLVPGSPAGDVGEAVYGTVGSWVDSGLGALGIGGGDPNQRYQEALAALNHDLVATNTLMPDHLSTELPQIDGNLGSDDEWGGWNPDGTPPGGGLPGGSLPGGGDANPPGIGDSGLAGGAAELPREVDSAGFVEGVPGGVPAGLDESGGGLAGTPGGPSISGSGPGGGLGAPGAGGAGPPGGGGGAGVVTGGVGLRPGVLPLGGAGAGGVRTSTGGVGRSANAGSGRAGTGAGGGMMPMGGGGAGSGGGAGKTGGSRLGGAGGARAAGGMMPMGGAGGRGSEEKHSSHESWLVEDDDPWGTDEADNVPPGVIK